MYRKRFRFSQSFTLSQLFWNAAAGTRRTLKNSFNLLTLFLIFYIITNQAGVAKLVIALACHAGDRGFELSDINGFNAYGVSYLDGKVSISSDIAEHPIEDGSVITDAAIIKPITAEVRIVMPTALYTRVYQQIYDYYVKKQKIMLKTKFGMIKNMVIAEMPFELKMEEIDRPVITLSLREIIEVSPENVLREFSVDMVANPDDSDTSDNGRRIGNYVVS